LKNVQALHNLTKTVHFYSLHYAKVCDELMGLNFVTKLHGNNLLISLILKRWQIICNAVSDLTGSNLNYWPPTKSPTHETSALPTRPSSGNL